MSRDELHHPPPLLAPGRNCWVADAPVDRVGLLIDADSYYRAFYHAARQARQFILLSGWRFNSDAALLHCQDAQRAGTDAKLKPFLLQLLAERPELKVYVLAWDFSIHYTLEWELFQKKKFEEDAKGRIIFQFDGQHAVTGSHHEKVAVIDGQVAFVGGLDFNTDSWDDRRHLAEHPKRVYSNGKPRGPYHDIQAVVKGPAAWDVTQHLIERWKIAGGGVLNLPCPEADTTITVGPMVPLTARRVALSKNRPKTLDNPEAVLQIRQLYLDAIAAAQELIYIENQYFSSHAAFEALVERMKATNKPKLEIVLVLPKRFPAWIETVAVGPPRLRMIEELWEAAERYGHRLGIYSPAIHDESGCEKAVTIHSKLMVVDDTFLTVGSCNLSNRSMALDTELNVSVEATPADERLRRSIRRARVSLLAEHCGLLHRHDVRRELRRKRGLVEYLDRIAANPQHRLCVLTRETIVEDQPWIETLQAAGLSFDPEKPWVEEAYYETIAPAGSWVSRSLGWLRGLLVGAGTRHRHPRGEPVR
jgi:phosphatidylserine/phosphatidylglycerophosphate/cardiolipin synthase-like enzyme